MKAFFKYFFISILFLFVFACSKDESQEKEEPRSYVKSIERIYSNEFEENLIDKAEKYYPPREEMIAALPQIVLEIPESKYWYYNSFDGVKIPFCVTVDAIEYYSDFIDELNLDKEANFFIAADFKYKAKVEFKESYTSPATDSSGKQISTDEYTSVYVVTLELDWSDYCGNLCALWIDKERVVVFNDAGEILKVYKDGIIAVAVS